MKFDVFYALLVDSLDFDQNCLSFLFQSQKKSIFLKVF